LSSGRNHIYYSTFLTFCLANLGCALSPNIAAFLIFRFLAGFFGSPGVANSAGSIVDLWPDSQRSVPLAFYTVASFCGPVLAPIIGGILTQYVSWRWNFWVVLIVSAAIYSVLVIWLPETYPPRLLQRKLEGHGTAKAEFSGQRRKSLRNLFALTLTRPWIILVTEPILISLSLYMAFVYGVLFIDFTAYPIVFQKTRGWSLSISGLSFLGIGLGMVLAAALSPLVNRIYAYYVRKLGEPGSIQPEARLPHLIIAAWLLPLGLFWFGWTALPPTPWQWSIVAGVPFGFGLVMLFLGITAYLTDCYSEYSTSALAACALLRSLFGAGFAVFAESMYESMGTPWATSVLGFVALALALLPPFFYRYGARIRSVSKFHVATVQQ
jgi:multidrug resistance protein